MIDCCAQTIELVIPDSATQ